MTNELKQQWQALFQKAVAGVVNQGCLGFELVPCVFYPGENIWMCRYRTSLGKACGVGQLIPNDKYLPRMEGQSVHDIKEMGDLPEELRPFVDQLAALQSMHDSASDERLDVPAQVQRFVAVCRDYAAREGIEMPPSIG